MPDPVVLELATLPREQMGPFLLLGLDKSADKELIDKHWADRVKWALRVPPQVKIGREEINWAHELLKEVDKRIRFDVAGLNADTADGILQQLSSRYGVVGGHAARLWQPLDREKPLEQYVPPAEAPDAAAVLAGLTVPEIPEEFPAAAVLLERLVQAPLDPWALELPPQEPQP
jgi:hypothetical protein